MSNGFTIRRRLLHVTFNFVGGANLEGLAKQIGEADDWIHYLPSSWFLYTGHDQTYWAQQLRIYLGPKDHMLICVVNPNEVMQGWMPQWVWDWVNKKRQY